MNKKKIFIWALYDFANSIVMIAFFLYFSQWLVIDRGVSDFWFNITLAVASLLFVLVGPILGSVADKTGNKVTGIRISTVLTAILYLITGSVALFAPEYHILAAVFFTLATTVYLTSFIYYNSFLADMAPLEKRGIVSGYGLIGNYLGQISAILIALPFVTGTWTLWGEPGRAQAFLPATIIFFVLALPLLVTFKKEKVAGTGSISLVSEYTNVWKSFQNLWNTPNLARFFVAYFFFNDAVLTTANNFPIYMDKVFGVDDSIKSYVLLGVLVTSAISSPLSGWIADRIGFKKTLMGILAGWIVIFPILAFTQSLPSLFVVTVLMGFLFGSVWTVTRAMVTHLTPPQSLNQSYTYFTFMERFATFVGPVSWGLIVAWAPQADSFNYRSAALAMTIFIVIGLVILRKMPKMAPAVS